MQANLASDQLQPVSEQDPIDLAAVQRFLARHLEAPPAALTARRFGGGRSNYTFLLTDGQREWVLRRPPTGDLLPTAHDMRREHRVLTALAETNVPVARPLALCTDTSVIGAPFYVMERRTGFIIRNELPAELGESPAKRSRVSYALIETLADLHAVDWRTIGLARGYGKPDGYLERQLKRWSDQWNRSKTRDIAAIDDLQNWVAGHIPASPTPTIVHGDFRLENCMFDPLSLRVSAVLDWEMSTLGDPLADLGWTLAYWPAAQDPLERRQAMPSVTTLAGFPSRQELIAHYQSLAGRSTDAIHYYEAFAFYKLAIIAEGIYRRVQGGQIRLRENAEIARSAESIAQAGLIVTNA